MSAWPRVPWTEETMDRTVTLGLRLVRAALREDDDGIVLSAFATAIALWADERDLDWDEVVDELDEAFARRPQRRGAKRTRKG